MRTDWVWENVRAHRKTNKGTDIPNKEKQIIQSNVGWCSVVGVDWIYRTLRRMRRIIATFARGKAIPKHIIYRQLSNWKVPDRHWTNFTAKKLWWNATSNIASDCNAVHFQSKFQINVISYFGFRPKPPSYLIKTQLWIIMNIKH